MLLINSCCFNCLGVEVFFGFLWLWPFKIWIIIIIIILSLCLWKQKILSVYWIVRNLFVKYELTFSLTLSISFSEKYEIYEINGNKNSNICSTIYCPYYYYYYYIYKIHFSGIYGYHVKAITYLVCCRQHRYM